MAAGAPWWLAAGLGVVAVVLGILLTTRPLSSLAVLAVYAGASCIAIGVAEFFADRIRFGKLLGLAWLVLGVVVLAGVGRSVALLPVVLAIALLVSGVLRIVRSAPVGTWDARVAGILLGLAELALGALVLWWPDVTLVMVAVVFGVRTAVLGVWIAATALRQRFWPAAGEPGAPRQRGRGAVSRAFRLALSVLLVLAAVAALGISGRLVPGTAADQFYEPPSGWSMTPGTLLRSERAAEQTPGATTWRILYTTTDGDGTARPASGLVVIPDDGAAEHPVIAWAHGTTGYAQQCAPSLLDNGLAAGALLVTDQVIAKGWALVATDYAGLGTAGPQPYLIGQGEARSVLDAVRAARQLSEAGDAAARAAGATLSDTTVVWGHSQGGHAALWTGQVQPSYAPDVPLAGVAAMAPASDVVGLTQHLPAVTGGSVFGSYVIEAYRHTYPDLDVDAALRPGVATLVREMSTRCLSEPGVLVSVLTALSLTRDPDIFAGDPTTGALGALLRDNVPTGPIDVPLLLAQGAADPLITPDLQGSYVAMVKSRGQKVDYRTYEGLDHMGLVTPGSPMLPELFAWTTERFAAKS